jgi:hypothetical protein
MNKLNELSSQTCTEQYWVHWAKNLVFTDGVKYVADNAGAYWLIDAIASHQPEILKHKPMELNEGATRVQEIQTQFWTLELTDTEQQSARLTMQEDSGKPLQVLQEIPYTDFPFEELKSKEFKLYLMGGVLLLPYEY